VRSVVIVVVLPFAQLVIEQVDIVGDAVSVQELVELLLIYAMRALHLAIKVRCPGSNVDMADVALLEMELTRSRGRLRAFNQAASVSILLS